MVERGEAGRAVYKRDGEGRGGGEKKRRGTQIYSDREKERAIKMKTEGGGRHKREEKRKRTDAGHGGKIGRVKSVYSGKMDERGMRRA